jgi:hypothetical protein
MLAIKATGRTVSGGLIIAFDKGTGAMASIAEVQDVRDSRAKPGILSFEPVSAAQGTGGAVGGGLSNLR